MNKKDAFQNAVDALERQNYKTAYKLFLSLAEQGLPEAQNNVGLMYYMGEGIEQDYKEAVKWTRLAADQGDADAQYNLGQMYYFSRGVPQDSVLAHMWWNLAGSNGMKGALENKKILEEEMSKQQIEKAQELARNWKPKK